MHVSAIVTLFLTCLTTLTLGAWWGDQSSEEHDDDYRYPWRFGGNLGRMRETGRRQQSFRPQYNRWGRYDDDNDDGDVSIWYRRSLNPRVAYQEAPRKRPASQRAVSLQRPRLTRGMGRESPRLTNRMGRESPQLTNRMGRERPQLTNRMGRKIPQLTNRMGRKRPQLTNRMGRKRPQLTNGRGRERVWSSPASTWMIRYYDAPGFLDFLDL